MGEQFNKFISENQEKTLAYLRKNFKRLYEDDLKDVYQDSSIALFNNIKSGQYEEQDADMYTYFLKICINQAIKAVKQKDKTAQLNVNVIVGDEDEDDYQDDKLNELIDFIYEVEGYDEHEKMRTNNLVQAIMKELSEKCQDLLWGFYGYGLSWAILADEFGLANADSAKSTANRCRNQFKDLFNQKNARIHG